VTPRERLLAVMHGEIPDHVPCSPDISNMVPCRLTGKPFWDIYVYQDPPLWLAQIESFKYFGISGGLELMIPDPLNPHLGKYWNYYHGGYRWIVDRRDDGSFVTQDYDESTDAWSRWVVLHTPDNPPTIGVSPEKLGLPPIPSCREEIKGIKEWPTGVDLWKLIWEKMGSYGVVGIHTSGYTTILGSPEDVYSYYDNPEPWRELARQILRRVEERMEQIAKLEPRPDVIHCSGSGTLVFQTPTIFRELGLPILKRVTELASDLGIPTHCHSCGPEKALVEMAVKETKLTVIDPLEVPPMGDCDLAELKRLYGTRIVLKGNLHTTKVMLHGTVDDVVAASKKAIDDAAAGGAFILSTGDQCGRDTPDENIFAMVETCATYGEY